VGCTVLIICGLFFSAFLSAWSCIVAGIFHLAGCDAGSVVVSPRRGFCRVMGTLPVDICAVSNAKVSGYYLNGGYVKIECVLTCLSGHCKVWFCPL
jgi:hypothetical protein